MTALLDKAVETARRLPAEAQDQIAHMVLLYADLPVVWLAPDEHADLAEAEAEIARGEFATDDDMRALWAKYGR